MQKSCHDTLISKEGTFQLGNTRKLSEEISIIKKLKYYEYSAPFMIQELMWQYVLFNLHEQEFEK